MTRRLWLQRTLCVSGSLAVAMLGGCAVPPRVGPEGAKRHWQGRMTLHTEGSRTGQWAMDFVLEGSPESGELLLSTPWGQTIAAVRWQPGRATLRQNQTETDYPDLDRLTLDLTGTVLPLRPLFAWLEGQAAQADGWQVDLGQYPQGRLQAQRESPAGVTRLKLTLERP